MYFYYISGVHIDTFMEQVFENIALMDRSLKAGWWVCLGVQIKTQSHAHLSLQKAHSFMTQTGFL